MIPAAFVSRRKSRLIVSLVVVVVFNVVCCPPITFHFLLRLVICKSLIVDFKKTQYNENVIPRWEPTPHRPHLIIETCDT